MLNESTLCTSSLDPRDSICKHEFISTLMVGWVDEKGETFGMSGLIYDGSRNGHGSSMLSGSRNGLGSSMKSTHGYQI